MEILSPDKCSYFEDDALPVLVLALRNMWNMTDVREWKYIAHQTSGHGCIQQCMVGTILQPRSEVALGIEHIASHWFDSQVGFGCHPNIDQVLEYRSQLLDLGVDCKKCYREFEEAFYPIDCTIVNIRKSSSDDIPDDFSEVFVNQLNNRLDRCHADDWHLYILGENSD